MTLPALSLVPLDAHPEPEQLVLTAPGCWLAFARAVVHEDSFVIAARRRHPQRAGAKCASAPAVSPYAGDLETYRAPVRRAPRRVPAVRPKRAPARDVPAAPIRTSALRVLGDEINLPRSRRRKFAAPRRMIPGESPESLGDFPMTPEERAETELEVEMALAAGETFGPPDDDRDCPTGPCPHVGCKHNLYADFTGRFTTLNFPGLHIDEVPETCSLRAARQASERRNESRRHLEPAMSCAEIGRYLNLTPETIRKDLRSALAKLRAGGMHLK